MNHKKVTINRKKKLFQINLNKIKNVLIHKVPNRSESKKNDKFSLHNRMLKRLKSAKFRLMNDKLNNSESSNLTNVLDHESFEAYHEAYEEQMSNWPIKPIDVIIKNISTLPETHIIADMGCGNAMLAKNVKQKVYSFDLKPLNEHVIQCDIENTPLEKSTVNVVVFSLSLMNCKKLNLYIKEANRILKFGGLMTIAELESRFEDVDEFVSTIEGYGFSLSKKNLDTKYFYFFDFIKVSNIKNNTNLQNIPLKPYLYKKR